MRQFRTQSASLAPAASSTAQHRKLHSTSHHARAHKLVKVKDAAKRALKTKQPYEPTTAYVGNFGPEVDENALIAHFSRFGNILSARIHCCGGVAMTYGIVTFETKLAQSKACDSGGTLGEHKLVVSPYIFDLPEFQEKIKRRLDDYMSRQEDPDERRARESVRKSLKRLEPTVIIDGKYERLQRLQKLRRNHIMGVTFPGGIM